MPAHDDRLFSPPAPVVQVKLRHPASGKDQSDISMLMDSGADVTLVPKSAADSLEFERSTTKYELVAFDGATSVSEAVHAELFFWEESSKDSFSSSTRRLAF